MLKRIYSTIIFTIFICGCAAKDIQDFNKALAEANYNGKHVPFHEGSIIFDVQGKPSIHLRSVPAQFKGYKVNVVTQNIESSINVEIVKAGLVHTLVQNGINRQVFEQRDGWKEVGSVTAVSSESEEYLLFIMQKYSDIGIAELFIDKENLGTFIIWK